MKKQVFTLMTTIALLSASPVLAMENSAKEDKEEMNRIPVTQHEQPTLPMFQEIEKQIKQHGYFNATDGKKYTYDCGNPVDDVLDYFTRNPFCGPWTIIVLSDIVDYTLPDYAPINNTPEGTHDSQQPSFIPPMPMKQIAFKVVKN